MHETSRCLLNEFSLGTQNRQEDFQNLGRRLKEADSLGNLEQKFLTSDGHKIPISKLVD